MKFHSHLSFFLYSPMSFLLFSPDLNLSPQNPKTLTNDQTLWQMTTDWLTDWLTYLLLVSWSPGLLVWCSGDLLHSWPAVLATSEKRARTWAQKIQKLWQMTNDKWPLTNDHWLTDLLVWCSGALVTCCIPGLLLCSPAVLATSEKRARTWAQKIQKLWQMTKHSDKWQMTKWHMTKWHMTTAGSEAVKYINNRGGQIHHWTCRWKRTQGRGRSNVEESKPSK